MEEYSEINREWSLWDWFPYAISHGVYILPCDKGPRFHDELKIRVGDLKNFANSLFYLTPTKLSVLLSFFHLLWVIRIQTKWNIEIIRLIIWHLMFSSASFLIAFVDNIYITVLFQSFSQYLPILLIFLILQAIMRTQVYSNIHYHVTRQSHEE